MAHQRTLIRRAIRDLLKGKTVAGQRVYTTSVDPFKSSQIPAVSVFTTGEESSDGGTAPRELTRELDVEIAGWVTPGAAVDDAMDALALQIETAMHADPTLGGVVGDSRLVSTALDLQPDGDRLMGLVVLTYAVTYRTYAPEATADEDMDDFLAADVIHQLVGVADEDDAIEEVVEVQEAAS